MERYIFQLGRERVLALAELAAILPTEAKLVDSTRDVALIDSPDRLDLPALQEQLGGTVKIGQVVTSVPQAKLAAALAELVKESGVRDFGISVYGSRWSVRSRNQLGLAIKQSVKTSGQKPRFASSQDLILSSVFVRDQLLDRGREFLLLHPRGVSPGVLNSDIMVGQTVLVQDWQSWSNRDYGRPIRDSRRGMLPPKLARMMINLARLPHNAVILDPFCGVGTVIQEAALLGYQCLIGADRDPLAITAASQNLAWLAERRNHSFSFPAPAFITTPIEQLATRLAQSLSTPALTLEKCQSRSVNIITEADLGPPDLKLLVSDRRTAVFRALEPAYRRWLTIFKEIVQPNGVVVLAYPILMEPKTTLSMAELAQQAGWEVTPLLPKDWLHHPAAQMSNPDSLTYARPDQIIGRQIVRLVKPAK